MISLGWSSNHRRVDRAPLFGGCVRELEYYLFQCDYDMLKLDKTCTHTRLHPLTFFTNHTDSMATACTQMVGNNGGSRVAICCSI